MMNQMAQHETTHYRRSRQRHHGLATAKQRPFSEPAFVARTGQRRPRLLDVLVESRKQISSRLRLLETERRSAGRSDIQLVLIESMRRPTWYIGQVRRQATKRR